MGAIRIKWVRYPLETDELRWHLNNLISDCGGFSYFAIDAIGNTANPLSIVDAAHMPRFWRVLYAVNVANSRARINKAPRASHTFDENEVGSCIEPMLLVLFNAALRPNSSSG